MNNIISSNTPILSAFPTHEAVRILKDAGYGCVEIWPEGYWKEDGKTSLEELKKAFEETGLKGVIHTPCKDEKGEKLNVCSKYEDLRMKSIDAMIKSIRLAKELGFHLINIHPGHMDRDNDDPEEYWPILKESFEIFVKEAEKLNIILAVEAMEQRPKEFVMHAEDLKRLFSFFNSENLGATLDLTHAFTHGEEFAMKHLEELGVHLRHMHASGYYGIEGKTHCPFNLDKNHSEYFRNILKEISLNYDGIITVEGSIKGIIPETKENQLKIIKENLEFVKTAIGDQ